MPDPASSPRPARRRPSPWLIVPAAVVVGLLLFVVVWLVQREPADTTDPTLAADTAAEQAATGSTLPAPQVSEEMTADAAGDDDSDGGVFILPPAPAEPPRGIAGDPPALPAPALEQPGVDPAAGGHATTIGPRPVHSPAPTYPRSALRRGLSGEVLVRAQVGVDGRPRQVEVARSSSHRVLDQAALRAVRGWRFQPAMQDGQPVAEPVEIPVQFNP